MSINVEVLPEGNKYVDIREAVGMIPHWLNIDVEGSASQQLDRHYQHGGGWCPFGGSLWTKSEDGTLQYRKDDPDDERDPPLKPIVRMQFREETVYMYDHAWVCIVQPDGSFEVSRMD